MFLIKGEQRHFYCIHLSILLNFLYNMKTLILKDNGKHNYIFYKSDKHNEFLTINKTFYIFSDLIMITECSIKKDFLIGI